MNQEAVLWVMTGLFTLFSGLGLLVLRGILQDGRDTNAKVTTQGESLARLEGSSSSNASEMSRLRDNLESLRAEVSHISGAQEVAREIVIAFTDATRERRRIPRREDDR